MANSSRPTRILFANSRDTNQLSGAKKVSDSGRGVVQIDEINWPANDFRRLADSGEVNGWWKPADGQVDVGVRSQTALSGRPEDEDLSGPESPQQRRYTCEDVRVNEKRSHYLQFDYNAKGTAPIPPSTTLTFNAALLAEDDFA